MKKLIFIFLLLLISADAKVIKKIEFKGLLHISEEMAREIIGFREGDELNYDKISESIKNFYKQKHFQDIYVTENQGVLTYHFKEKAVIGFFDLKGFKNSKDDIIKALGIKKGDIYDEAKIKRAKEMIKEYYKSQGYFDSIVEEEIEEINQNAIKLTLIANKGEKITIKKINFIGNRRYDYSDFKSHIANREAEFMGWFIGRSSGELKIFDLEYDNLKIEDFYKNRGYLDVKVSPPLLKADFGGYFADITYHIEEGEPYRIESIDFILEEPVISIDKLKEGMKSEVGDRFNLRKLRKDLRYISDLIADKGYAFSKIIPDIKKSREKHKAKITYYIIPNKQYRIRDIVISGNRRTLDRVIRREIYLSEGKLFSATDLRDSKMALKRTGYFSKVTIKKKKVSDNELDLLVNVEETSTGSIVAGIGYGSYDGLMFNFSITDKNVFGSGIDIGANLDYSSKTTRGTLSFYNPRFNDSTYSLGGSLYSKTFEGYDYDEDTKGLSLTVGKKLTRNINTFISYSLDKTKLTNLSEGLNRDLYREGNVIKSAIIPGISYDSTDDYFVPREGIRAKATYEYAGIGGDVKFFKQSYLLKAYYGLQDIIFYDLILRFKAQTSFINELGYLPINEKLYLGGVNSVRGYKSWSLSPKDNKGNLIGGKRMASTSLEASIPLIPTAKMRLVFFYDKGWVGEDNFDISRSGVGTAVEWFSPLGPIQFIFSRALDDKPGDSTSSFEFTIGRRF